MTWDQVEEMVGSGLVDVGSHSHTHPDFDAIDHAGAEEEVGQAHEVLASRLGLPGATPSFAYPRGVVAHGEVVAAASGMPFGEYVERHIFQPLGMTHSFAAAEAAEAAGLAGGYRSLFGVVRPGPRDYHTGNLAAGYLVSSASDLARYAAMWQNDGRLDDVAVVQWDEGVLGFRGRTQINRRADTIAQLEVAGNEVRVQVREQHVLDSQTMLGRIREILLHVALRIDNGCGV